MTEVWINGVMQAVVAEYEAHHVAALLVSRWNRTPVTDTQLIPHTEG